MFGLIQLRNSSACVIKEGMKTRGAETIALEIKELAKRIGKIQINQET